MRAEKAGSRYLNTTLKLVIFIVWLSGIKSTNFSPKSAHMIKIHSVKQSWQLLFTLPQIKECKIVYVDILPDSIEFVDIGVNQHYLTPEVIQKYLQTSSGWHFIRLTNPNTTHTRNEKRVFTYERFRDIHRYSRSCGVGLLFFGSSDRVEDTLITQLFNCLVPLYGPILRKDEDHFLFFTSSEVQSNELLLSKGFGSKIKFKLGINFRFRNGDSNLNHWELKAVELYGNQGRPQLKGITSSDIDFDMKLLDNDALFPEVTKNFKGATFKMSIPKVDFRFEMVWNQDLKRFEAKRGYYKWWLEDAMARFNFTCDLIEGSFGGSTGKLLENGTWLGAVADILDGTADWAFVVGHIYSRHKFVEWSGPLSYEQMVFLTHKPRTFISPEAIYWPFSPLMWALFLVTLLFVPFVFKRIASTTGNSLTYGKMLEHVFATFLEQDQNGPYSRPPEALKILGAFWLLSAMTISVVYKAKLTALLAFPVSSWVPSTFQELAESHFRVGLNVVGKGGAAYSILASSQSPVYKSLFTRMEFFPNADKCLVEAAEKDLCCIMWEGVADYFSARNLSDRFGNTPLQTSIESTSFIADGLVWEKRAVFRKHLDVSIWSSIETGLVPKWFEFDQQFIKSERFKQEHKNQAREKFMTYSGPKKLTVDHFEGLFYMFVGGIFVSGIRFISEVLSYWQLFICVNPTCTVNKKKLAPNSKR